MSCHVSICPFALRDMRIGGVRLDFDPTIVLVPLGTQGQRQDLVHEAVDVATQV